MVLISFLLLCVAGVQFISCRKPVSADPEEDSTDFNFSQKFTRLDSLLTIDSVTRASDVNLYTYEKAGLRANEVNAGYNRELEDYSEKANESKSFSLDFPPPYGRMEVQLMVKKELNLSSFPQEDGTDEVTAALIPEGYKFKYVSESPFTDNTNEVLDSTIVNFGERPGYVP